MVLRRLATHAPILAPILEARENSENSENKITAI